MRNRRKYLLQGVLVIATVVAASRPALAQSTVTVHWNVTHQTIDGFGTSQGGDFANLIYDNTTLRSQVMDRAFSLANGIGLTIFRSEILSGYENKGEQDCKASPDSTMTIQQNWIMQQAKSRGPVKLIGTV